MARIEERVIDGHVLDLIRGWFKADILKGLERWTPTGGTPQGGVLSPLLANIYLDPLDKLMAARGLADGAVCGRLRRALQEPGRRRRRTGRGWRVGRRRTA